MRSPPPFPDHGLGAPLIPRHFGSGKWAGGNAFGDAYHKGDLVAGAEAEPMDRCPEGRTVRETARTPVVRELRHHLSRADLRAVAEARGLLREHLSRWGMAVLSDTAELLVSELVTNALVHTDRGAFLTARPTLLPSRRLRVEVYDFAAHHPRTRAADDQASNGRGLLIVRALSDAWGVSRQRIGKTVWFELSGATA